MLLPSVIHTKRFLRLLSAMQSSFVQLWGHVSWQDKNATPAPTVMKAIYLRGNLSSPKCSDPILAMQLCFLCTPCLSAITGPRNWSILPFGFGVLGHQNVPMLHTVERQPPAYRIHCKITCHQMQEESICSLYTQPEIFSHECHFSTWLSSKNKGLKYYHVVTSKASSPSDSHFRCEKHDEKWSFVGGFCVLFALQLKSPKVLWFSPCWTIQKKIQLSQQLSSLVSPCKVQPTLPFLLMTHEWNRCFLV